MIRDKDVGQATIRGLILQIKKAMEDIASLSKISVPVGEVPAGKKQTSSRRLKGAVGV